MQAAIIDVIIKDQPSLWQFMKS